MNRTEVLPTAPVKLPKAGEPALGLDNYEIGHEIARGGMGSILKAGDTKLKREVAIKIMALDAIADDGMRQRFLREAEVLAMLAHPNIVPIHDIVWEDGAPLFYSMKLVKGQTLQAILHDLAKGHPNALREYTLDRLLLIFRKVCDAMAFAHSKSVLHRDLKPDNIMVGEFGEVLVMDWGLARFQDGDKRRRGEEERDESDISLPQSLPISQSGLTLQGSVMGTPQYMSPEQARGEVDDLDERSDIFSLGAILYAILTLRPPVEGKTAQEVLEKVTRGEITAPSSLKTATRRKSQAFEKGEVLDAKQIRPLAHLAGGRVPPALSSVVMHALQLDKEQRYPSVIAFSEDIEAYQGGFATRAQQAGALRQMQLLVLRHKVIANSLAVLLLFSVGFVLKVMASERHAQQSLAKAQISLAEAAFRRRDLAGMVTALEDTPADLRGQEWHYYSAKRDTSLGFLQVKGFTHPVEIIPVPGHPRQFALSSSDGRIAFVEAPSGTLLRTLDTGTPGNIRFCFSGDGRRILCLNHGAVKARLLDVATFQEEASFTVLHDNAGRFDPRFSQIALNRTGDLAAFVNVQHHQLQLIETLTGVVRWTKPGTAGRLQFHPNGKRLFTIKQVAREFDLIDTKNGGTIVSLPNYPQSMALSPDGRVIALGLNSGEIVLMDPDTGKELRRAQLHSSAICSVNWTSGGHLLTIGGEGEFEGGTKTLRLWDPQQFGPRGTFFGIPSSNPYLEASLDVESGYLLTKESPPQLWHVPDVPLAKVEDSSEQGWSCNFLSNQVLLARKGFELSRYDLSNPAHLTEVAPAYPKWHAGSAAHLPSGLFAIGKPIPSGPKGPPSSLRLMRLTSDGGSELWNRPQPQEMTVHSMDFDEKAERLLFVHRGRDVQIVDVRDGSPIAALKRNVYQAAFAGTQGWIAAFERPKITNPENPDRILLIAPSTDQIRASLTSAHRLNALAVSPDRRLVAVAGDDQIVIILDADTLTELHRFRAHDAAITALKFHPSKPILATGSADFSIRLWDYATAQRRQTFLGLNGRPIAMSFSPNGKLLAVDGMEKSFRIYEVICD